MAVRERAASGEKLTFRAVVRMAVMVAEAAIS